MSAVAPAGRAAYVQGMDMPPPPTIATPSVGASAMSSRLVVMMTPADKAALEARARDRAMTTSEFVRQATAAYDERVSPEEERLLEVLSDEFVTLVADIRATLQQTNAQLDAHFAEMEAIRNGPKPEIDLDDDQIAALHDLFWAAGEVPA